jgi:tetratricopeptide (TPR) repeat protein
MEIFISWSGERSRIVAEALKKWLHLIIQSSSPWMSEHDISKGTRWGSELAETLDKCNFGILCLTAENLNAPWILFEAGALSKSIGKARIVPYLLDISFEDVKGPLQQFNMAKATKDETRKLLTSIRQSVGTAAPTESDIDELFEKFWPELEQVILKTAPHSVMPQPEVGDSVESPSLEPSSDLNSTDKLLDNMIEASVSRELSKISETYKLLKAATTNETDIERYNAIYLYLRFVAGDTEAIDKLQELASTESHGANGQYWLGACYEASEKHLLAACAFSAAADKSIVPASKAGARVNAARSFHRVGEKERAYKIIIDSLSELEGSVPLSTLYSGLAELFELDNDYLLRAACLEKALDTAPNNVSLHFQAGYAYSHAGTAFSAISVSHYTTLLQFDPNEQWALNNLGVQYYTEGIKGLSAKSYRKAKDLGNTLAAANLSSIYIYAGLFEDAAALLNEAQKRESIHKDVGKTFSSLLEAQENESEAQQKVLVRAREQQGFVLSFTNAFFDEKLYSPSFGGAWITEAGVKYSLSIIGQQIDGTWKQGYTEYKLTGTWRNRGASFTVQRKGLTTFDEDGQGYMYLSHDGSQLEIMVVNSTSRIHSFYRLAATMPTVAEDLV